MERRGFLKILGGAVVGAALGLGLTVPHPTVESRFILHVSQLNAPGVLMPFKVREIMGPCFGNSAAVRQLRLCAVDEIDEETQRAILKNGFKEEHEGNNTASQ